MNEKLEINKEKNHIHQLKKKSAQKVTKHEVGEGCLIGSIIRC